jgi:hypothetical protein
MATYVKDLLLSDNAGRVFVAPASRCNEGTREVWVCLGAPFSNMLEAPAYQDCLKVIVTKDQYDDLLETVVELLRAETPYHRRPCCRPGGRCFPGVAFCKCFTTVCAPCICLSTCLCLGACAQCLCCCATAYAQETATDVASMTTKIGTAFVKGSLLVQQQTLMWSSPVRLELVRSDAVQSLTGEVALDQNGSKLARFKEPSQGVSNQSKLEAVWAPEGLNLVFSISDSLPRLRLGQPSYTAPDQCDMDQDETSKVALQA